MVIMPTKSEYGYTIHERYEWHHYENGKMIRDDPESTYDVDCICPKCINCDIQRDECKIGRWRYPTDGCFDFIDVKDPNGENTLSKLLKTITR
jgi:hypothetical protein